MLYSRVTREKGQKSFVLRPTKYFQLAFYQTAFILFRCIYSSHFISQNRKFVRINKMQVNSLIDLRYLSSYFEGYKRQSIVHKMEFAFNLLYSNIQPLFHPFQGMIKCHALIVSFIIPCYILKICNNIISNGNIANC